MLKLIQIVGSGKQDAAICFAANLFTGRSAIYSSREGQEENNLPMCRLKSPINGFISDTQNGFRKPRRYTLRSWGKGNHDATDAADGASRWQRKERSQVLCSWQADENISLTCAVISASFEQSLFELMYPLAHDGSFPNCRACIASVLSAMNAGVPQCVLKEGLVNFAPFGKYEEVRQLSALQRQTVQAFVDHVYDVASMLESRGLDAIENRHLYSLPQSLWGGASVSCICLMQYCERSLDICSEARNKGEIMESVVTRKSMLHVWREVLKYLTVSLWEHLDF